MTLAACKGATPTVQGSVSASALKAAREVNVSGGHATFSRALRGRPERRLQP